MRAVTEARPVRRTVKKPAKKGTITVEQAYEWFRPDNDEKKREAAQRVGKRERQERER